MKKRSPADLHSLRLKHCVELRHGVGGRDSYFLFGNDAFLFDSETTNAFRSFKRRAQANDIRTPRKSKSYESFLRTCNKLGLLFQPHSQNGELTVAKASAAIESALAMWKPLASVHPVFNLLAENKKAFAIYLLELTYFISQAETYMAPGVRATKNVYISEAIQKLICEERDHHIALTAALNLTPEQLDLHDPCAGTHALVTHLFYLASTNPLSLVVSLALFETDPGSLNEIKSFFDQHKQGVAFDPKPFTMHHQEDLELGHVSLWKACLAKSGRLSFAVVDQILSDLHMTKHMIDLWRHSVQAAAMSSSPATSGRIDIKSLIRPKPMLGSV